MHKPEYPPGPEYIERKTADVLDQAKELENALALLAIDAGRGTVGLALNVAKTQVSLAIGQILRAQAGGSAVGSG